MLLTHSSLRDLSDDSDGPPGSALGHRGDGQLDRKLRAVLPQRTELKDFPHGLALARRLELAKARIRGAPISFRRKNLMNVLSDNLSL